MHFRLHLLQMDGDPGDGSNAMWNAGNKTCRPDSPGRLALPDRPAFPATSHPALPQHHSPGRDPGDGANFAMRHTGSSTCRPSSPGRLASPDQPSSSARSHPILYSPGRRAPAPPSPFFPKPPSSNSLANLAGRLPPHPSVLPRRPPELPSRVPLQPDSPHGVVPSLPNGQGVPLLAPDSALQYHSSSQQVSRQTPGLPPTQASTGSGTVAPPFPPFPPDAQAVMQTRQAAGRPLLQPLIMFLNEERTLCYSNAGTNFILSAPPLVEFLLRLPSGDGVPWRFREFALTPPTLVRGRCKKKTEIKTNKC